MLKTAIIAAAGLCGTAAAQGVIMQMQTFSGVPDFTQSLTFNQFDGSLGPLASVEVILELNIEGGVLTVDNDGVEGATVTVELGANAGLSSNDVTLLDGSFDPIAGSVEAVFMDTFDLAGNDGDPTGQFNDDGGADNDTLDASLLSDSQSDGGFVNSLFFADYIGNGTFDIIVDANQSISFGSVSGVAGSFSPVDASGKVTVIYTFVPTPATAGLLGLGGLVAVRRRR